jgi:SAM-dependent methyltransferase
MLAPRKKLYSTPITVLDVVSQWVTPLKTGDVVCDIGCGDGRVLLHLAKHHHHHHSKGGLDSSSTVSFVGLDISPHRIQEASHALQRAQQLGSIPRDMSIKFICANAMDSIHHYQNATIIFLYLIPRGLKIFKPMLYQVLKHKQEQEHLRKRMQQEKDEEEDDPELLRVVTYMSPLPDELYTTMQVCHVEHHQGSAWPVYLYHLTASSNAARTIYEGDGDGHKKEGHQLPEEEPKDVLTGSAIDGAEDGPLEKDLELTQEGDDDGYKEGTSEGDGPEEGPEGVFSDKAID